MSLEAAACARRRQWHRHGRVGGVSGTGGRDGSCQQLSRQALHANMCVSTCTCTGTGTGTCTCTGTDDIQRTCIVLGEHVPQQKKQEHRAYSVARPLLPLYSDAAVEAEGGGGVRRGTGRIAAAVRGRVEDEDQKEVGSASATVSTLTQKNYTTAVS